jgi:hypothetical protein
MLKKNSTILILLFLFIGSLTSHAQRIAINNNLLFDAMGSLSAGVEVPLSKQFSVEAYGSIRPWKRGDISVHKHWSVQSQFRVWPCQVMNGFFFGPYAHYAQFNFGNRDLFFGLLKGLEPNRYEGWLVGGGIGGGYEYPLSRHWSVGAEIGIGYTYIKAKKYDCEVCGKQKDFDRYDYVGISRLGLSVIYVF